jgi:branched-chain amino acid transport system substrate-binding protein
VKNFKGARWLLVMLAALLAVGLTAFAAGCGDDEDTTSSGAAPVTPATPSTGGASSSTAAPSSSAAETTGGGETLKIVSDLPLQGASGAQTTQMVKAITYYLNEIAQNKAGNYTIQYESKDDSTASAGKWDPAKCTANAEEYAADESIVGVIGTFNSGCAQIEIPILNEAGVAMISPANTGVGLTHAGPGSEPGEPDKYYPTGTRNYARVVASDDFQGAAAAQFAQQLGVKKLYIMHDNETYGKGVAEATALAAKKLGIEVVGPEPYDPKASDYTSTFNAVKGVDGVFIGAIIDNNGAKVVKDKVSVLGDNTKVKLFGPDGMLVEDLPKDAGPAAEGMYLSVPGSPASEIQGPAKELLDKVQQAVGGKLEVYTSYGIQAAQALLKAIENSDGSRESVVENLLQVNIPADQSALGRDITFDENGDVPFKDISFSVVKGSEINYDQTVTPDAALLEE